MKVLVLAGGLSRERDVSLASGTSITNALKKLGHKCTMIDIFFGINDISELEKEYEKTELLEEYKISNKTPDVTQLYLERNNNSSDELGENVIEACKSADICFLALHGGIGENGKLQALLDIYNIKYTGTDSISSAIAMQKAYTKKIFNACNIPNAKGYHLKKGELIPSVDEIGLQYPVVIKICSGGSSIGVYMADNNSEYLDSINKCFEMEDEILIEEFIKGREFAVPVLCGKAMPVIEIIPENGWFDYEHKYQDNKTSEVCPAQISNNLTKRLQQEAVNACNSLGIQVYARSDFRVSDNGHIYCVEVNTLPGMTTASLFPKSCKACNMSYEEMCETIIEKSLEKYQ